MGEVKVAACRSRTHRARPSYGFLEKTNFLNRINLVRSVNPLLQKYSVFQNTQISCISIPSRPTKGRFAVVTNAGRDAMDAKAVR